MTSQEWTAAVASPPGDGDAPGITENDAPKKKKLCVGSCEVVKKMLDFSLLRSPTFIIFSISGMFSMLGMFVRFYEIKCFMGKILFLVLIHAINLSL